jgi:glyoxylase-like metal-dependent hydrolase (beta-lactamase superfamily II)
MTSSTPAPIRIGEVTIHRIVEQEAPMFDSSRFFPNLSAEMLAPHRHWMVPRHIDETGRVVLCIQSYLVRTPHHNILVDTCVGNHKERPARKLWDKMTSDRYERSLAATGVSVGDIDYVMCTHLHVDHVGWNTRLDNGRWVPTFPNAKYLFSARELAYWSEQVKLDPAKVPWITDSVLPVIAAGKAEQVASDHRLGEHVGLMPTPGHTIDHFSVEVGSGDAHAIITGDAVHSPIQCCYPELGMFADYDGKQGGESRRRLFELCADRPTKFCAAHFASPSVGHIKRAGDSFRFVEG